MLAVLALGVACRRQDATADFVFSVVEHPVTAPPAPFHSRAAGYTNWWYAWSTNIHVGGYLRAGQRDPKWDEAAIAALSHYAYLRVYRVSPPGRSPAALHQSLKQAVEAGCTDPFIQYLHARHAGMGFERASLDTAGAYGGWARAMDASEYPAFLKFFVNLRASQAFLSSSSNPPPELYPFRAAASVHLERVLTRRKSPPTPPTTPAGSCTGRSAATCSTGPSFRPTPRRSCGNAGRTRPFPAS